MGIKDFYKYLKTKHPDCFVPVHFSQFNYQKVAIDMMNLLYIYKARHKDHWLQLVISFLFHLRRQFIHPICVFDGQSHPLKYDTVQKRRTEREKGKTRLEQLKLDLQLYNDTGQINDNFQNFLHTNAHKDLLSKLTRQPIVSRVLEHIDKQYSNYDIHFRSSEIDTLKTIIEAMGICVLTAKNDGEALCSYLSATEKVDLVMSNDSDVFFFGCKRVIIKFTEEGGYLLEMDSILAKMELTHEQFIDLCLLCGTDFNTSIRGIGFCRAYALIKQHQTIKNVNLTLDYDLLDEIKKMTIPEVDHYPIFFSKPIDKISFNSILFQHQVFIPLTQVEYKYSEVVYADSSF